MSREKFGRVVVAALAVSSLTVSPAQAAGIDVIGATGASAACRVGSATATGSGTYTIKARAESKPTVYRVVSGSRTSSTRRA